MAKFGSCHLIPNLMPQIPNMLLCTATVQDEDVVIAVKSNIEVENAKS